MSDPRLSDEDLARIFRNEGDQGALDRLVRRHLSRVRAMVFAMVLNEADADDLTQEVFVRAIRGLPRFAGRARFSTWISRIAMNTVRTFWAKRAGPVRAADDRLVECASGRVTAPDASAMAGELDSQITAALATLSPPLRAAIVLTALEGVPAREAARIENCTVPTMYWRVHKARKILRKQLARYLA